MHSARLRGILIILTLLITAQDALSVKVSELILRQLAIRSIKPHYPGTSVKNKNTGVAVAKVQIDQNGKVKTITVVQAPDAAISEEVRTAVRQWTFDIPKDMHLDDKTGRLLSSTLTFYFKISGSTSVVLEPQLNNRRNK